MNDNTAFVIVALGTLGVVGLASGISIYISAKAAKLEAEKRKSEEEARREFDKFKENRLSEGDYINLINNVSIGNEKLSIDDRSVAYEILTNLYRKVMNSGNYSEFELYSLNLMSKVKIFSSENENTMAAFVKAYLDEKAERSRIADIKRNHEHELAMVKCKAEADKYIAKETAEAEKYKARESADIERYKMKTVANAVESTAKALRPQPAMIES